MSFENDNLSMASESLEFERQRLDFLIHVKNSESTSQNAACAVRPDESKVLHNFSKKADASQAILSGHLISCLLGALSGTYKAFVGQERFWLGSGQKTMF